MGSVTWGLLEVIAAGCGPVVKLWAPTEPQQAMKINEGTPVYCLDFSHNNRVLAVAGEKGQANLYSGKGAAVATGCSQVGTIPRTPTETADSVTCIKFAPNDTYIVGGCRNGRVHIWSLKDEMDYHLPPLPGSITSVAIHPALTCMAASSSAGQVLLYRYPSDEKLRTLLSEGGRVGCLGFAPSQPSLLCAAKGSGQLLVWDLVNSGKQTYEEYNVHRAIVTGCSFAPNDANLLISCGHDGLLACTDRRANQVAWDSQLRQPLESVSMRWDGTMVAVGTGAGRVLVHDTRRISTTLAVQEFSDELPVTALRWQHMPSGKAHKSGRHSMGAAAAAAPAPGSSSNNGRATATAAPSSSSQVPSGSGPGSLASRGAAATTAPAAAASRHASTAVPVAARTGTAGAATTTAAAAAGSTAGAPAPKVPLVVPGWDSGIKSAASSSSDADASARVISPVRGYGSPLDSDFNSAGLFGGAGGGTAAAAQRAAAAAAGGFHTPEVGHNGLVTPADSSASGPGGYRGPAMFTPGIGFMGHMNPSGPVTPFAGPTADVTPVSRFLEQPTAGAAATGVVDAHHDRKTSAAAAAAAGSASVAAAEGKGTVASQHASQAGLPAAPGATAGAGRAVGSRANAGTAAVGTSTGTAAASGRSSRPSGGGVASSTAVTGGSTAAAGGTSHWRKTSDSAAAAPSTTAPSTTAAAPAPAGVTSSRSARPSTAEDSSAAAASASETAAAADGSVVVVAAKGSSGISSSSKVAAVGEGVVATAAGQQRNYSSTATAAVAVSAVPAGVTSSSTAVGSAGVSGVTGVGLREDVFKAYVDARMNALQEAVTSLHADMQRQFAQSQADLAVAMNSLAARQDQLAEAITQLTAAVQHMGAGKQQHQHQQQQYQSGVAMIPWI